MGFAYALPILRWRGLQPEWNNRNFWFSLALTAADLTSLRSLAWTKDRDLANKYFLRFLGVTGVATIIVLVMPASVVIGMLLGGLPGLFLMIAPTLFMYLAPWWGLKWLVLKLGIIAGFDAASWPLRCTAILLPIAPILLAAFKIPAMINAPREQEIVQLQASDVKPAGIIKLPATVAIELPASSRSDFRRRELRPSCEALCLRLLYNGAVSRVIAAARFPDGRIEQVSFRIERRDQCPEPELPYKLITWLGEGNNGPYGIAGNVQARIAAGECLVRDAGRIEEADAIVSVRHVKVGDGFVESQWNLWLDLLNAQRLEIIEAGGRVLYRYTQVHAALLAAPLRWTTSFGLLSTAIVSGWVRRDVSTPSIGSDGRDVLPGILGAEVTRPPDPPETARP
jgi:hypothetical protein